MIITTSDREPSEYKLKTSFKYEEVNDLWKNIKIPFITRAEAEKAKNLLLKKFGAKRFMPPGISSMRGKKYRVRKTWICLSGDPSTLKKGWRDLIHEISHWLYWRRFPGRRFNHSFQQAEIEFEICKYVISSGWLGGSLKPEVIILSKEDKRQKKIDHLQSLINKWQRKQKIANTFIRKYTKKLKYHTKK